MRVGLFGFNLLPKPFQRNPQLELTVFTGLTDFGRKQPAAPAGGPKRFQAVYPVQYDPMSAEDIAAVLAHMHACLYATTPAQLVDRETGDALRKPCRTAREARRHHRSSEPPCSIS